MKRIRLAMPTKLYVHANTILSMINSIGQLNGYQININFLPGKTNIDQARSILITNWYDSSEDDDLFLFIDNDQTFSPNDIKSLIELNSDIAVGVYCSLAGYPTCRPKDYNLFLTGENNDLYYGATGFMLIRKPILKKIEEYIKKENGGISRFWISHDNQNIIPFFKQRLIISETIPLPHPVPEWLGEDYSFCWMARQVGATIKCHISKTIGHEVIKPVNFYPLEYKSKKWESNTIVYYTGPSFIKWSPHIVNEKGMSGSETAVYYLSKYWQNNGYKVVVYGNCHEGTYDGIEYLDYNKLNTNDYFNIIILWRSFGFRIIDQIHSKKIIVDLHDSSSAYYNLIYDYYEKIDIIMVKSIYHKYLFKNEIHDKMIVIENGIPDCYFNVNNNLIKNKYKMIYASSYDRGLYEILKWCYPLIKKEIPEVEFHIYYGMELLPEKYKKLLLPYLQQEGVHDMEK